MTARRFHAYNVGLPRTGTTSIAGIFGRFRTAHEFMDEETMRAITALRTGQWNERQFEQFILDRDGRQHLEMESSSYAAAYVQQLVKLFPDARFVFTVRDCFSWLRSLVNLTFAMMAEIPSWRVDYGRWGLGVEIAPDAFSSREEFRRQLPHYVDGMLRYWATANEHVLRELPPERSLVVKTREISSSLSLLADLVDVPHDQLVSQQTHLHATANDFGLLSTLPDGFLRESADRHCRPLMEHLFPAEFAAEAS